MQKTQHDLRAVEEALRHFEKEHNLVALDEQTKATVQALAIIEGQIMADEVCLEILQRDMTGANREVYLLQQELQALRDQLARLQSGSYTLFLYGMHRLA